jgi:hypothetical protein
MILHKTKLHIRQDKGTKNYMWVHINKDQFFGGQNGISYRQALEQ